MGTVGILVGILILSLMMILHELGHYLAGRALRFTIEEFSIFMGPKLFSWTRKGILYSIRLFPIGAFVRFAGEETRDAENPDPGLMYRRPRWARAVVISAGPIVNLVAGLLAFAVYFSAAGYELTSIAAPAAGTQAATAGLAAGDRILSVNGASLWTAVDFKSENVFLSNTSTMTLRIRPADGSADRTVDLVPVEATGYRLGITTKIDPVDGGLLIESVDAGSNGGAPVLKQGDLLLSVDGVGASDRDALAAAVRKAGAEGRAMTVAVRREGVSTTLSMKAMSYEFVNDRGVGFAYARGFGGAIGAAFTNGASLVKLTFRGLSMMITGAIKPQDSLSGPVGIVAMVGGIVAAKQSFVDTLLMLLTLFAWISINLGVFNLLPIPALDGSQLVLIGVEAARGGKRLPEKLENAIVMVGFAFIISLALLGLVFDVLRLVKR